MTDIHKLEVLRKCKEDLTFFGKTISPKTYYLDSPPFHLEMDDLLMDRDQAQTMIEAPRGTAKSTKAVDATLHHITFDKGDKVVVLQSKTRQEALKRLGKIKNILEYSQPYRGLFGYSGEQVATKWRDDYIKTRIGGDWVTIAAIGTGQQMRGVLEDDTRITLYLLDDPDDENSCVTKDQMDKNFDRFLGGVAGLDRRNGRVIVIGTPIRAGCIVDRLRDAPGWVTKRYEAYDEDTKEPLWGEMYSYEWLMTKKEELKAVGKISKFYSEYMCQIVGDEDQLFKEEYLQYWDGYIEVNGDAFLHITHRGMIRDKDNNKVLRELEEPIIKPVNVFIGVDPASSTKRTADFSVTMPVAYDGKDIYVLPYFRERVTPTKHAEQIIDAIKSLSPTRGHIETVGYQEMLRDYLRNRLMEEDLYLPGLEKKFNPRTEKSERLEVMHPLFYNRRVYVQPNMTELIDELLTYPRGKHDDTLDGMYYATRKLLSPDHTVDKKETISDLKYFIIPEKANGWQTR